MARSKADNLPAKKPSPPQKLRIGGDGFDAEVYNDIATSASLLDVRLVESSFAIRPECIGVLNDSGESPMFQFSGKVESIALSKSGICVGTYVWTADIKDNRLKALKIKSKYIIAYGNLKGKDLKYVGLYFEKLAKFTSFPYFRSLMATHVSAANLVLPPLPSITDRVD